MWYWCALNSLTAAAAAGTTGDIAGFALMRVDVVARPEETTETSAEEVVLTMMQIIILGSAIGGLLLLLCCTLLRHWRQRRHHHCQDHRLALLASRLRKRLAYPGST